MCACVPSDVYFFNLALVLFLLFGRSFDKVCIHVHRDFAIIYVRSASCFYTVFIILSFLFLFSLLLFLSLCVCVYGFHCYCSANILTRQHHLIVRQSHIHNVCQTNYQPFSTFSIALLWTVDGSAIAFWIDEFLNIYRKLWDSNDTIILRYFCSSLDLMALFSSGQMEFHLQKDTRQPIGVNFSNLQIIS